MKLILLTNIVPVTDHKQTSLMARQCRIESGLSVRELAKRIGWSAPYVSDMERGNRIWTQCKVDKWNKALNTP